MLVTALPAARDRNEFALTEYVYPGADVAECLSPAGGARGSSESGHVPKYRGVTVALARVTVRKRKVCPLIQVVDDGEGSA